MLEVLFIAFIVIIGLQLCYYLLIFNNLSPLKQPEVQTDFNKPVSVLICCKNEAENLKKNLPYFLNQSYSSFELVLINDRSSDATFEVMESFKKKYPSLVKIVDVAENEQFWGSKKYALTLGIKAAAHEHLLFSDADCKPNSKHWIKEMCRNFSNDIGLILGYGAYRRIKSSLLNKLIRLETLLTAVQYFSYLNIGLPYMGVGRNMAYTKTLFFTSNGFANHMHLRSGDDDLFVNENANNKNTTHCIDQQAFTTSEPKDNWSEWVLQKRRHLGTAHAYKTHQKVMLGMFYISQLLFWVLGVVLASWFYRPDIVLSLLFIRFAVIYMVMANATKKLNAHNIKRKQTPPS